MALSLSGWKLFRNAYEMHVNIYLARVILNFFRPEYKGYYYNSLIHIYAGTFPFSGVRVWNSSGYVKFNKYAGVLVKFLALFPLRIVSLRTARRASLHGMLISVRLEVNEVQRRLGESFKNKLFFAHGPAS